MVNLKGIGKNDHILFQDAVIEEYDEISSSTKEMHTFLHALGS
jgi:hypothetical protein